MNTPSYKHISPALHALAGVIIKEEDIGPVETVVLEGDNISDSTIEAYTDESSPDSILSDKYELFHIIRRTSPKNHTEDKASFCLIKDIITISEPVPVKNIDYIDETPLSSFEDTIDREPKDSDVWTKIEYIRDKEENN